VPKSSSYRLPDGTVKDERADPLATDTDRDPDQGVDEAQDRLPPGIVGVQSATTKTTALVMPVVTISSRRSNRAMITVPSPITTAMPSGAKGKIRR
jgi:hypothetical protein